MSATVRRVDDNEFFTWLDLYAGYGEFYETPLTDEKALLVWSWLTDSVARAEAYFAVNEAGEPIGLAHVREFARPLDGSRGLYLDDLFVSPDARGEGAATALLESLRDAGPRARVSRWSAGSPQRTTRRRGGSTTESPRRRNGSPTTSSPEVGLARSIPPTASTGGDARDKVEQEPTLSRAGYGKRRHHMSIDVRPVADGDFFAWLDLYEKYAEFYETTLTDQKALLLWSWLTAPDHEEDGLVAVDGERIVGLAHFREFAAPARGRPRAVPRRPLRRRRQPGKRCRPHADRGRAPARDGTSARRRAVDHRARQPERPAGLRLRRHPHVVGHLRDRSGPKARA